LLLLTLLNSCQLEPPINSNHIISDTSILVTTPSYLGHQFQSIFQLNVHPSLTESKPNLALNSLPLDILILPVSKMELLILDRSPNSSLLWVDRDSGTILNQIPLGPLGSHAQGIVQIDSERVAISFLNYNEIWIVSTTTGALLNTISTQPFVGKDTKAEIGPLAVSGNILVASLLGIDQSTFTVLDPREAGLLFFDLNTFELLHRQPLLSGNIYERLRVKDTQIIALEAGNFNKQDGLISHIVFNTSTGSPVEYKPLLKEIDIQEELGDFWINDSLTHLFVIGSANLLMQNDARVSHYERLNKNELFTWSQHILDERHGGIFRSIDSVPLNAEGDPGLVITSQSQGFTGLFLISETALSQPKFIPFPDDAPPERCVLIK
jgi:hypothetical protein